MVGEAEREGRWAIILAGGDGVRLRALTRKIYGQDVPKQFCSVVGKETLLDQTRRRAALSVDSEKSIFVVSHAHERFYASQLSGVPSARLVTQPQNRGTAPAVLYSLLRLAKLAPEGSVAIFPSDHYVEDAAEFMRHVDLAFQTVRAHPEFTVLLGIKPETAETEYGWIEPSQAPVAEASCAFRVRRFWEKPGLELAHDLVRRGCLWNSFVMVARLSTLLGIIATAAPDLYRRFNRIRRTFSTPVEEAAIRALYRDLDSLNFSEQVLEKNPLNLAVLPVFGVAWSDLGEPHRVMDVLARTGARPEWAAA